MAYEVAKTVTTTPPVLRPIGVRGIRPRSGQGKQQSVSLRWRHALDLHLSGMPVYEIAEQLDCGPATVYKILNDPRINELRQQIMKYYDQDFEALYSRVIDTVRSNLSSEDEKVKEGAAKLWLKAHGKFQTKDEGTTNNFTAEQIIFQILNQAKEERDQRSG